MLLLTRDVFLLTRKEEKIAEGYSEGFAEGYAEGYAISLAEARAKYAEKMRAILNRLIANGFTREQAIDLLGENIQ